MPRIKHQVQEEHLQEIKSLVEFTFGQKILNINDCNNLSNSIFGKVKSSVSTDTLRRIFGLIETKSQPSLFTLEILSKYVGFDGYYDFINSIALVGKNFYYRQILDCTFNKIMPFEGLQALQKTKPSSDYYSTLHQLILLAYQKKDRLFFERIFINQSGFEWTSVFKYEIYQTIQLLGKLVEENTWLQEIALENYISLPYFFDYFIEWYVADEQTYYLKLLEEYKKIHNNEADKQLFYHCILGFHAYKNKDNKKFINHFKEIKRHSENSTPNNIIKSRILGIEFLHDTIHHNLIAEKNLLQIDFEALFPDIGDRVTSMFFLFNYLFDAKAFSLMATLLEKWGSNDAVFFSIWTRINWNQLCVYMTYAYMHLNRREIAINYYNQINTSLFEVYNSSRFDKLYNNIKLN